MAIFSILTKKKWNSRTHYLKRNLFYKQVLKNLTWFNTNEVITHFYFWLIDLFYINGKFAHYLQKKKIVNLILFKQLVFGYLFNHVLLSLLDFKISVV